VCAFERMGASRVSDEGAGKNAQPALDVGSGRGRVRGRSSEWYAGEATDLADHVDEARLHVVDNSESPCETRVGGEGQMRERSERLDRRARRVGVDARGGVEREEWGRARPALTATGPTRTFEILYRDGLAAQLSFIHRTPAMHGRRDVSVHGRGEGARNTRHGKTRSGKRANFYRGAPRPFPELPLLAETSRRHLQVQS
jgi:hypothetical protein